MTIMEAIAGADAIKPNQIDKVLKIKWLSELDGRLNNEIFDSYGKGEAFTGYTEKGSRNQILLVPEPYDSLYIDWLVWHIEETYNEQSNANNTLAMFNNTLDSFKRWYIRTHQYDSPRIKLWR